MYSKNNSTDDRVQNKHNSSTFDRIIQVSADLFFKKGYEKTTMQDIVNEASVSKGAIFHYFSGKEKILDVVISKHCDSTFENARRIAADTKIPIVDKFIKTALACQISEERGTQILGGVSRQASPIMLFKLERIILDKVSPILAGIVEEGVEQGYFDCPHPKEAVEMILSYSNVMFDAGRLQQMSINEQQKKMQIYIDMVERVLGSPTGSLSELSGQFVN